jgi:hypothetical protein
LYTSAYFLSCVPAAQKELQMFYEATLCFHHPVPWIQELRFDLDKIFVEIFLQNK